MRLLRDRKIIGVIIAVLIAGIAIAVFLYVNSRPVEAPQPPANQQSNRQQSAAEPAPPSTGTAKYDLASPDSLTVVVNKKRPLPDGYAPADLQGMLRAEALAAAQKLTAAARAEGVALELISGYRSQATQARVYNSYVQSDGRQQADTYSARPRYSEHQTGLAADFGNAGGVCALEICFAKTPGGRWLAANAHKYGFIIRYPEDKTAVTGYQYEPWHLRYVGTELAGQIKESGKTMEEFFGLPAAPTY